MVLMTGEGLGQGDEGLGRRLSTKFLHQLATIGDKPEVIAFYNAGVRLLLRSSPAIEALKVLEADGVELIACGTCVDHFEIGNELGAGRVSDMREIATLMLRASKVVTV